MYDRLNFFCVDAWHVTHGTWQVTSDTQGVVNIVSKFQLPNSNGLGFTESWKYFHKPWLNYSINLFVTEVFVLHHHHLFFTLYSVKLLWLESKEPWRASCPLRKVIKASSFFHISVQINFSSTIKMQRYGSIKSLPCSGLLLPLYELMKLGVLAIWTLKWP